MIERLEGRLSPISWLHSMNLNPRTASFLFTDLGDSTPLWENHAAVMQALSARHDALIREVIEVHPIECFAYIALERGQYERASRLLGASGNALEQANMKSAAPHEIAELDQAMERLAKAMGEEERDTVLAEGEKERLAAWLG